VSGRCISVRQSKKLEMASFVYPRVELRRGYPARPVGPDRFLARTVFKHYPDLPWPPRMSFSLRHDVAQSRTRY